MDIYSTVFYCFIWWYTNI